MLQTNNNIEDERENANTQARTKALNEIFFFYVRQHIRVTTNFEEKEEKFKRIALGEFLKFVKDFEIGHKEHGLHKNKLMEIFKKSSHCHMPLEFE